jgi:sugar lactone lactonase YvrE
MHKECELIQVKNLRRFINTAIIPMPKQSLIAMKLVFATRAQYANITLAISFLAIQLIGVAIFSQPAQAAGVISYKDKIDTRSTQGAIFFDSDEAGNTYVANKNLRKIIKYDSTGKVLKEWGASGSDAGQFGVESPSNVAVYGDEVLVVDPGNNRIQIFDAEGENIAQFGSAGSGNGQFNNPRSVAKDSAGNYFVLDGGNSRVQKFNSSYEYQIQFGSAGTADGQFSNPNDIVIDQSNNMYVSQGLDYAGARVQKFNSSGVFQLKFTFTAMGTPFGMDVDQDGNVYVADALNDRIWKSSPSGSELGQWRTSTYGNHGETVDVHVDVSGNITAQDRWDTRLGQPCVGLRTINQSGTVIRQTISGCLGSLTKTSAIAAAPDGTVYAAGRDGQVIHQYNAQNQPIRSLGGGAASLPANFGYSQGIAVNKNGDVYVADPSNWRVQRYNANGEYLGQIGGLGSADGLFAVPAGIAVDSVGNVYVVDEDSGQTRVQKFTSDGVYITKWGSYGSGNGQFNNPHGIGVDANGYVYVADSGNDRIQKFDSNGNFISKWGSSGSGNGQFLQPHAVAVTPGGMVFVTDVLRNNVQKFSSDGQIIATFGGPGTGNGQFTFVPFASYPASSIAVSATGDVYVADGGNNRIQIFSDSTYDLRVTTTAPLATANYGATLGGLTNDLTNNLNADYSFEYGPTQSYGQEVNATLGGTTPGQQDLRFDRQILPPGSGIFGYFWQRAVRDELGNSYIVKDSSTPPYNYKFDRIMKFNSGGELVQEWDPVPDTWYGSGIYDIAITKVDSQINIYALEVHEYEYVIARYDTEGSLLDSWEYFPPVEPNGYIEPLPVAISIDPISGNVYTLDIRVIDIETENGIWGASYPIVTIHSPEGDFIDSFGSYGTGNGQFGEVGYYQTSLAISTTGRVYVTDGGNNRVQYFDLDGNYLGQFGGDRSQTGLEEDFSWGLGGIASDSAGTVYVNDLSDKYIRRFDQNGNYLGRFGGPGGVANLQSPGMISVSPQGEVLVSDNTAIKFYQLSTHAQLSGLTCETTYNYRAKAVSGDITVYGQNQTFTTGDCLEITSPSSIGDISQGEAYSVQFATNFGSPTYSVSAGTLPPGLSLGTNGQLSGTPTTLGEYTFTVQAEVDDTTATKEYTITVIAGYSFQITTESLPEGQVNEAYNETITATSDAPASFSLESGSVPGLSLSTSGELSGTPTTAGDFDITVSAIHNDYTATKNYTVVIAPADTINPGDPEPTPQDPEQPSQEAPAEDDIALEEQPSIDFPAFIAERLQTREPNSRPSNIARDQQAVPTNQFFALAKRIPEPVAIGFPWLLLTLALVLVSIQYYQVHSESRATKRMQSTLANQERLVEEQNNFVALSTHYLHTPLTVMEGEISLMVKAGTLTQEQATKLKATLASLNAEAEATLAEKENHDA